MVMLALAVVSFGLATAAFAAKYGDAQTPFQQMPVTGTWVNPCTIQSVRTIAPATSFAASGSILWTVHVILDESVGGRTEDVVVADEPEANHVRNQIAAMRKASACIGKSTKTEK